MALAGTIRRDWLGLLASCGFVSMGVVHALAYEAPPWALGPGVADLAGAAAALAAVAAGLVAIGRQYERPEDGRTRTILFGSAALAVLYLASVAIVTVFQPSAGAVDPGFALGARARARCC